MKKSITSLAQEKFFRNSKCFAKLTLPRGKCLSKNIYLHFLFCSLGKAWVSKEKNSFSLLIGWIKGEKEDKRSLDRDIQFPSSSNMPSSETRSEHTHTPSSPESRRYFLLGRKGENSFSSSTSAIMSSLMSFPFLGGTLQDGRGKSL